MLDDAGHLSDGAEELAALPPVEKATYKTAMRRFASGVTVITTVADGLDHAMTATAFSAVSLEPPLVLVCVDARARIHQALRRNGYWGVSMLPASERGREVSDWLSDKGRPLRGQLDRFDIRRGVTGSALLVEAIARLECRTTAMHPAGDHTIVVGEVVAADGSADPAPEPLVHYAGGYRTTKL